MDKTRKEHKMIIEITTEQRDLLKKIIDSYTSELRQAIAATKRDTASLHAEEDMIEQLRKKLIEAR